MGQIAQVERVGNGFLVKVAAAGFKPVEQLYIAATIIDVAAVLEEFVWPAEDGGGDEPDSAPVMTLAELETSGLVARGSDFAASRDGEKSEPAAEIEQRWPVAEDGSDYPKVTFEGGRYTVECPSCGPTRAEFKPSSSLLRCQGKQGGKPCRTALPKDVVDRIVALTS